MGDDIEILNPSAPLPFQVSAMLKIPATWARRPA